MFQDEFQFFIWIQLHFKGFYSQAVGHGSIKQMAMQKLEHIFMILQLKWMKMVHIFHYLAHVLASNCFYIYQMVKKNIERLVHLSVNATHSILLKVIETFQCVQCFSCECHQFFSLTNRFPWESFVWWCIKYHFKYATEWRGHIKFSFMVSYETGKNSLAEHIKQHNTHFIYNYRIWLILDWTKTGKIYHIVQI